MSISSSSMFKGFDRAFCIRMKSTLTKRGCHFKSSGYRVSSACRCAFVCVVLCIFFESLRIGMDCPREFYLLVWSISETALMLPTTMKDGRILSVFSLSFVLGFSLIALGFVGGNSNILTWLPCPLSIGEKKHSITPQPNITFPPHPSHNSVLNMLISSTQFTGCVDPGTPTTAVRV